MLKTSDGLYHYFDEGSDKTQCGIEITSGVKRNANIEKVMIDQICKPCYMPTEPFFIPPQRSCSSKHDCSGCSGCGTEGSHENQCKA